MSETEAILNLKKLLNNEKKNIMTASIQKYKLVFSLLFLLTAGVLQSQTSTLPIDSMVYSVHEPQYISCSKITPIDLFKVAHLYVSPENGYWGDANGVPYNGKASINFPNIKERILTNGNVFTPPASTSEEEKYRFYFYFTSANGYCGITKSTRFVLELYILAHDCLEPVDGQLNNVHRFCFGNTLDNSDRPESHNFTAPFTVADLLFSFTLNEQDWKKPDGNWLDMDLYLDREHTIPVVDANGGMLHGDMKVDIGIKPDSTKAPYDTMYYVIIDRNPVVKSYDSIRIIVYPKSELVVHYSPDIINNNQNTEYDIDEKITITVDTLSGSKFETYKFLLNNSSLNNYYLGGDSSKNEITISTLDFTGAFTHINDIIEIIAKDANNCIAQNIDNVTISVPFPTVFTPDGDGINDVFLGGEKFRNKEFHLEVNNRWGNRLYYGESGWDGTYKGDQVPPGTYLYVLQLKQANGSVRTVKGTVTLIRRGR
jgi:gliding motility-associated-like protein